MTNSRCTLGLLAALAVASCGGDAPSTDVTDTSSKAAPAIWFEEVGAERGLVFQHESGHDERYLYPEIVCGGAALFDMDGDGDLDAYLVQSGGVDVAEAERPGNQLFENVGGGRFEDVTAGSGADDRGFGIGVSAADYDNDGDVDLYVCNLGENALLRNDGTGRFEDVTLATGTSEDLFSAGAAFFDYDNDGDLDLWVVNYILWSIGDERVCYGKTRGETYCGPMSYGKPAPDTLFRNEGDGTFTDVSIEAGIRSSLGNGMGIGISDFDGDGMLDIFIANDEMKDQLWINRRGESFVERGVAFGCAADQDGQIKAGMGVGVIDFDNDGDEDLLVVNLTGEYDSFFLNEGTHFVDRTASVGLTTASQAFTRFGVGFVDFDQDGELDLFESNGRVTHGLTSEYADPFAELNLVYRGVPGANRFEVVQPQGGTREPLAGTSRGVAFGDVDGDGAVDALVVNRDGPAHLLLNRAAALPGERNWIRLRLVDHGRDALGAVVSMRAGAREITRRVRTSTSYASANDPRVQVGLGALGEVTGVRVRWMDGTVEEFGALAAGRDWTLRKGSKAAE